MRLVFLIIIANCFYFNNSFSQDYECNINTEYKKGFKIQKGSGRLVHDNKEGTIIIGNLIKLSRPEVTLYAVRLTYNIKTTSMKPEIIGLLRTTNSMQESSEVTFYFKNNSGGKSSLTLSVDNSFDVDANNNYVNHEASINIPKDALSSFTDKEVIAISIPFYDEYFYIKPQYQTIFIDYNNCFSKD